jgi:riboflavin synthase
MFTGIITDVGRIREIKDGDGREITIETRLPLAEIPIGGSIATSGICFTLTEKGGDWFTVTASGVTLEVTTAGRWQVGDPVNLERSLRIGDELGGHIVFGHVDAVGEITALEPAGESHHLEVRIPERLAPLIAVKGSVAVDGISLTINEAGENRFAVNIIPQSWALTNMPAKRVGDPDNVEVDMLARYLALQLAFNQPRAQ